MPPDKPRRPYGDGSITERKDGRWQVRVSLDGRQLYRYAATEAEAEKVRRDLVRRRQRGQLRPDPVRTERLDHLLDRWLATKDGVAAATLTRYRRRLDVYARPHIGRVRLAELTPLDVATWTRELARDGLAASTIGMVRSLVSEALEWAVDMELLTRNPARRVKGRPGTPPVVRVPPEHEHAVAFLATAADHPLAPLWHLAACLGLRNAELRGLTWGAVDWDRATIRVDRQLKREDGDWELDTPKTRAGTRTLPLCGDLPNLLRARRERQRAERGNAPVRLDLDLAFTRPGGEPVHGKGLEVLTIRLERAAGLPAGSIGLHRLRHGVATALLEMDAPGRIVQAIMGHERQTVTDKYQAVSPEMMRPYCERLAGRFEAHTREKVVSADGQ